MASNQKIALVSYRRSSSDMDLSSSDEEWNAEEKSVSENKVGVYEKNSSENEEENYDKDEKLQTNKDLGNVICQREGRFPEGEKLKDRGNDEGHRYKRSPENNKKDRRKSDLECKERKRDEGERAHYSKDRSPTPEKRKRRSRERSRGRSPNHHHYRHRSRSPRRHKHSPDRRDHRKRSHSPDRRSHKSRRGSRSPEPYRSKRLERKVARIDRLGLELVPEQKLGLRAACSGDESRTIVTVPDYFNPGASNSRITQQIQKRRLLWGNKKESSGEQPAEPAGTGKTWQAATFKGDNDGKMTEKFKRLMGIKGDASSSNSTPATGSDTLIKKQEEMFSNMEAQYQVARMATHTHRGIGLGFGTFQVPPR